MTTQEIQELTERCELCNEQAASGIVITKDKGIQLCCAVCKEKMKCEEKGRRI